MLRIAFTPPVICTFEIIQRIVVIIQCENVA